MRGERWCGRQALPACSVPHNILLLIQVCGNYQCRSETRVHRTITTSSAGRERHARRQRPAMSQPAGLGTGPATANLGDPVLEEPLPAPPRLNSGRPGRFRQEAVSMQQEAGSEQVMPAATTDQGGVFPLPTGAANGANRHYDGADDDVDVLWFSDPNVARKHSMMTPEATAVASGDDGPSSPEAGATRPARISFDTLATVPFPGDTPRGTAGITTGAADDGDDVDGQPFAAGPAAVASGDADDAAAPLALFVLSTLILGTCVVRVNAFSALYLAWLFGARLLPVGAARTASREGQLLYFPTAVAGVSLAAMLIAQIIYGVTGDPSYTDALVCVILDATAAGSADQPSLPCFFGWRDLTNAARCRTHHCPTTAPPPATPALSVALSASPRARVLCGSTGTAARPSGAHGKWVWASSTPRSRTPSASSPPTLSSSPRAYCCCATAPVAPVAPVSAAAAAAAARRIQLLLPGCGCDGRDGRDGCGHR